MREACSVVRDPWPCNVQLVLHELHSTQHVLMDIKSFTKAELETWLLAHEEKPFRARQILKWVYQKGAATFAEMTDLSTSLRALLSQEFSIARLSCAHVAPAGDGTRKYLFLLADQRRIESVLIPAED